MNSERWERINAIFVEAIDLQGDRLDQFLQSQCGGDQKLRTEVEKLLKSDEGCDKNFMQPSSVNVQSNVPVSETDAYIDSQLGNYQIKKKIGSGGMGNVYLAVRDGDFKQRVAIKILKRGMDSEAILKRFKREIRVLAALEQHPNIAGLIDAGTSADGLPYFVMEYVDGEEIDNYCDSHRLTVRERLELFGNVCSAVHFAHQHTIIHRDIKPSNVLVRNDGEVKLIDFGIAKLTAPELGGDTASPTITEMRPLTPAYASPEQIRGDNITTASDVYSLGVVLYQLLTGHRPYQIPVEAPRIIEDVVCKQDPVRPSTVVTSALETVATEGKQPLTANEISAQRRTLPQNLRRTLRGDLDNIILMALRKEARDRYSSVGQMAVDIKRHLNGEPVAARELSTTQKLLRVIRLYPLIASLLAAVLIGGTFGLAYLSRLSRDLVRATALESAAEQVNMLYTGHKYYTNVIGDIKKSAPEAADKLKPPATFTIELFDFLDESNASRIGTQALMRSRYPFKNRANRKPLGEFELTALDYFESKPTNEAYHCFDRFEEQPFLRYAIAMRMEQSCCDCHNSHPDSTKQDWEPGQVRGILEVVRPLATDMARTKSGLQKTFGTMGAIVLVAFVFTALGLHVTRRKA